MKITVPMKINSEKKHSVRYDAIGDEGGITSVYVMKTQLTKPYPEMINVSLEWNE